MAGVMDVVESSNSTTITGDEAPSPEVTNPTQAKCKGGTIVDGKFFRLVPEECTETVTVGECVQCEPNVVKIRGSLSSSSNFRSHLKRAHGTAAVKEYNSYLSNKKWREKKARRPSEKTPVLNQEEFNRSIVKFVVHAMVPLQVVDDPYFQELFEKVNIAQYGLDMISRRTLGRCVNELYTETREKLGNLLQEIPHLCTTTDIWSGRKRSFLGVTVHWIDNNCVRWSAALACRRFPNSHTAEAIAELLSAIHAEFNIDDVKIRATITDNGSNFVKAFKTYGIKERSVLPANACESNNDTMMDETVAEHAGGESEDESEIAVRTPLTDLVPQLPSLPTHLRCCAHTLNLIASNDLMKSIKTVDTLATMHERVISKCNALWKATGRPKSAEILQNILGHTIPRPCETRWNSLYDALQKILEIRPKSPLLFQALKLRPISDEEYKYIDEHVQCTKPIALALDILQGETFAYYGVLIPTLISLRRKLDRLATTQFAYCKPVAEALSQSLDRRFGAYFDLDTEKSMDAGIAAITHPEFKDKWLSCLSDAKKNSLLQRFTELISHELPYNPPTSTNNVEPVPTFFEFGDSGEDSRNRTCEAEIQRITFFNDTRTDCSMLDHYQPIKRIFLRYNTPLPSSAPVERLFSYATMANLPKCNRVSDDMFERRIIIRANLHLFS